MSAKIEVQLPSIPNPYKWSEVKAMLDAMVSLAVEKERSECARLVDHILKEGGGTYGDAIRARGELK